MSDDRIREQILDIVAKETRLDRASLTLDTKLGDLKIESLVMVQILFGIEDAFDVYIPQEDQSFRVATLRHVCDGVQKLIADKQSSA